MINHHFQQVPGISTGGIDGKMNKQHKEPMMVETASTSTSNGSENNPLPSPPPPPTISPWAKPSVTKEPLEQKTNLSSIMAQQQEDTVKALATNSSDTRPASSNVVDEEELIRLAIEASLNETKEVEDQKLSSQETHIATHNNDEMDEDMKLAIQLSMAEMNSDNQKIGSDFAAFNSDMRLDSKPAHTASAAMKPDPDEAKESSAYAASATMSVSSTTQNISKEEEEAVARAILEADDMEQAESLRLAMELQAEEDIQFNRMKVDQARNSSVKSNVRTVTKSEFDSFGVGKQSETETSERQIFSHEDFDHHNERFGREMRHEAHEDHNHHTYASEEKSITGYSINPSTPSKAWARIDGNNIVGPNNEIRTKHDVKLKHQSNADKLLGAKSSLAKKGGELSVSDAAYNSFNRSLKNSMKRSMVKGVERSGVGRAENMNEKTRGGALDGNVRLLISKAINIGLIQNCNGAVKEGKEAIVYHAEAGIEGDGFDIAVKVFKRIQEFKNRSAYVDDDPRYYGNKFRNANKRQQVELWTEKEYRNLLRASRAGVAVPTPIMQKENVLFMRFLGESGWPAAQLREVELNKGSKKWTALYIQCLVAIRRLFHCARLVHADLSEYNILVCPMSQVENALDKSEEAKDDLQAVLIDFGQAVERNHPSALDLLKRDLVLVNAFFTKQDIVTLSEDASMEFVVEDTEDDEDEDEDEDDVLESVEEEESSMIKESENEILAETTEDVEKEEWRHNISGWDDNVYMLRLESMLSELNASR